MSYRPEGWNTDKILTDTIERINSLTDKEYEDSGTSKALIEAGADAMLEALKGNFIRHFYSVIIPDETEPMSILLREIKNGEVSRTVHKCRTCDIRKEE